MSKHVWVIDDDHAIRWVLDRALAQAGIPIKAFNSADEAMHYLPKELPLAIITDIRMQGTSGLDFLEEFNTQYSNIPVIVMTAHSDLQSAVTSFERGAFEYLPKPFDVDEAVAVVQEPLRTAKNRIRWCLSKWHPPRKSSARLQQCRKFSELLAAYPFLTSAYSSMVPRVLGKNWSLALCIDIALGHKVRLSL
ncbi:MAG: hypothetical protein CM15mP68_5610 [Pseudomonadota bacterium]|nr:MAG: hypothetical protein CM15mP68_5610 [Pseudomonadota bacterium]